MATVNVNKHCISMQINKISQLKSIWSPEILIHGIPWKVQVSKKGEAEDQSLAIFLLCKNKTESPDWSLWGSASFKLLPVDGNANAIEHHTDSHVFDASGMEYGTYEFIKWNDLFGQDKKYVKDDMITLNVAIEAENPNDPNRSRSNLKNLDKCCNNSRYASFQLKIANALNLIAVESPSFKLHGLPLDIQISKTRSSHLGAMLRLKGHNGTEPIRMLMSIKLVSSMPNVEPIEICTGKLYTYIIKTLDV